MEVPIRNAPIESNEDRRLVEALPAAIYTCDLQGRLLFYNETAAALWGRQPEIGSTHWCGAWRIFTPEGTLISPEQSPMALSVRRQQSLGPREILIERPDGSLRHIRTHPQLLRDEAGNVTGAVNMLIDITDSKHTEHELSETRDHLALQVVRLKRLHALSEHLFELSELRPSLQAILDTLITLHHAQFGLVSLYDAETDTLCEGASAGFSPEALQEIAYPKPEKQAGACAAAFATKARMVITDTELDPRFTAHRETAKTAGFRAVHSTPIFSREGAILGVLSVHFAIPRTPTDVEMQLADICAHKAGIVLETARTQQELKKADRRKDEFLAHMSHEIRTPLNAVTGLAHILSLSHPLTPRQQKYIKTLECSAHTLLDLINDLLDVSKLDADNVELETIPFMLEEMMHEVIDMMNVRAREKHIQLSLQYDIALRREFLGDPLRLRQILTNLLGNAIKFTEKGSVNVALVPYATDMPEKTGLQLTITDTGIGIEPERLAGIFEKFSQANTSISRRYGGTGLGLSITKTLVEMMGGTIDVTSHPGKGTVFLVRLALEHTAATNSGAEVHRISEFVPTAATVPHILLVEDYPANVLVTTSILDNLGIGYHTADNGQDAVDMVKQQRFTMILMDVQMPEMDGFTATRLIRQYEQEQNLPRTPIIGITAYALSGDRERCLTAGMDDYISKPFTEEHLQARITVHTLLQRQHALKHALLPARRA